VVLELDPRAGNSIALDNDEAIFPHDGISRPHQYLLHITAHRGAYIDGGLVRVDLSDGLIGVDPVSGLDVDALQPQRTAVNRYRSERCAFPALAEAG
jgi:hypothetical protein